MSSTELSEWADFFRENSFSDALLDAEFSTLKAQVFMLVTGREIDAADFSLLTLQDFEMNGKGASPRPNLVVANLFGLVTGMAEDLQSLVGASVVRHQVYSKFLDAVNFSNGNPDADPEQEAVARYNVEQLSELDSSTATIILASPAETDGSVVPGRTMLADSCPWDYRDENCGYDGPPVADEFDKPTSDPKKDKCSHCMKGCEMRNNLVNAGFFASINKLS